MNRLFKLFFVWPLKAILALMGYMLVMGMLNFLLKGGAMFLDAKFPLPF